MRSEWRWIAAALALAMILPGPNAFARRVYSSLGHAPTQAQIAAEDIDVRADGRGLPPGGASAAQGEALFAQRCAACHGDHGQGGTADQLVGGRGTLASAKPVRTVGSYWPHATTLFDYVRRAMPYNAPGTLTNGQVYAVSAYVLWLNGLVPKEARLDRDTLPKIAMPNRRGFIHSRE